MNSKQKILIFFVILGLYNCSAEDILSYSDYSKDAFQRLIKVYNIFDERYNECRYKEAAFLKCQSTFVPKYFSTLALTDLFTVLKQETSCAKIGSLTSVNDPTIWAVILITKLQALNYSIFFAEEYFFYLDNTDDDEYWETNDSYKNYALLSAYLAAYGLGVSKNALINNLWRTVYENEASRNNLELIKLNFLHIEKFVFDEITSAFNYFQEIIYNDSFEIDPIKTELKILNFFIGDWLFGYPNVNDMNQRRSTNIYSNRERFQYKTRKLIQIIHKNENTNNISSWLKTPFSANVEFHSKVMEILRNIALQKAKFYQLDVDEYVEFNMHFDLIKIEQKEALYFRKITREDEASTSNII